MTLNTNSLLTWVYVDLFSLSVSIFREYLNAILIVAIIIDINNDIEYLPKVLVTLISFYNCLTPNMIPNDTPIIAIDIKNDNILLFIFYILVNPKFSHIISLGSCALLTKNSPFYISIDNILV